VKQLQAKKCINLNILTMKPAPYKYSRLIVLGLFIASISLFSGCNNPSKNKDKEATPAEGLDPDKNVIEELSGYDVPNSYEITTLIYDAGVRYNMHISNNPNKAGDYITQRDKVLNLGVYAADLCYATTYMMKQGTMDYLEASKTLIDDLGISTTFNINYADRIENNIDNRDSLISIVSESFDDTWTYMVENKQDVMARLVVCGSWIEGVYLTTKVAATAEDNTAFLEALARQKSSIDELVNLLDPVKNVDEVKEIYEALSDIKKLYEGVGESLTLEQLESISAEIEALRSSIV
jgi:hypothetical protein